MKALRIASIWFFVLSASSVHAVQFWCEVDKESIQATGDPSDGKYKMTGHCRYAPDIGVRYFWRLAAKYFYNAPYDVGEFAESAAVYADPDFTNKMGNVVTQAHCKDNPVIEPGYPGICTSTNWYNSTGLEMFNPFVGYSGSQILSGWASPHGVSHEPTGTGTGTGTGALASALNKGLKDWDPYAATPEVGMVVNKPGHNQVIPAESRGFALDLSGWSRWRVPAKTPLTIQWERLVSKEQATGDIALPQSSYWATAPGPTQAAWGDLPLSVPTPSQAGYYRVKAQLTHEGKAYQSQERRFWVGQPPKIFNPKKITD